MLQFEGKNLKPGSSSMSINELKSTSRPRKGPMRRLRSGQMRWRVEPMRRKVVPMRWRAGLMWRKSRTVVRQKGCSNCFYHFCVKLKYIEKLKYIAK